jgi:aspartyl-tRNA(Asn)/glutamyl-tRNA(Gln) amidotransferase subunit B
MEEDTGKTVHVGGGGRIHEAAYSLVDYNRAGIPLMEVVSRPDIRSAEQARAYVNELRAVLLAIEVSEVKMEEGAFRIDANVSMRREGRAELGTKVEVKNMNSLRSLGRALEYEIDRQSGMLDGSERVMQETRHWDENAGVTRTMRSKEEADDYRYFPEPDLVPIAPDQTMRERVRASMPELPAARRARLMAEWGITAQDARVLIDTMGLADYAEAAAAALRRGAPKDVVNWCTGDLLAYLHETGLAPAALRLTPVALAELIDLVADGTLSRPLAKDVLAESLRTGKRPREVVEERGLTQVSDEGELASVVDQIIAAHPDVVAEYRSGDEKTRKKKRGFLMGEAMKATKSQGNPQLLNRLLDTRLS